MKPTQALHDAGQSLWLDNITRTLLDDGTLAGYIDELNVSGLTSNPTIFEKAIGSGDAYDTQIQELLEQDLPDEQVFFHLAIDDLQRAADEFAQVHERSAHLDGFVSLEVSPLLAFDTAGGTIAQVRDLHEPHGAPERLHQDPRDDGGAARDRGGDLLGHPDQRDAAVRQRSASGRCRRVHARARAPHRRRPAAGRALRRLAVREPLGQGRRRQRAGGAAEQARPGDRRACLQGIRRAARLAARHAADERRVPVPQRLLWASTGTKDPAASDTLFIDGLAAPYTVNTMPDATLHAYADHGGPVQPMAADGGDAEAVLAEFAAAGIDVDEHSPRSCRPTARRRSSTRGRRCWRRSRRSAARWPARPERGGMTPDAPLDELPAFAALRAHAARCASRRSATCSPRIRHVASRCAPRRPASTWTTPSSA